MSATVRLSLKFARAILEMVDNGPGIYRGRAKTPQSVENCWLLCWACHRAKTNNSPNASHWLIRFVLHAEKHGYSMEADKARARMAFVEARGAP